MTSLIRLVLFVTSLLISAPLTAEIISDAKFKAPGMKRGITTLPKNHYVSQQFGNYHALIIANNNYQFLPKLRTSLNDARAIGDILTTDYGFTVKLLENATRVNIVRALNEYRQQLNEHDNILIYYAGHGLLDEEANEGFWLPVDAKQNDPVAWISNSNVTSTIRAMRAKHVLVIADSCYAGTLTRGITAEKRIPKYLQKIITSRARTALVSGGLEPVDDGMGKHSPFARALIRVLKENKGVLETAELFTLIRRPVILDSDQIPQYGDIRKAGHEGGDFLFVAKYTRTDRQNSLSSHHNPPVKPGEKSEFATFTADSSKSSKPPMQFKQNSITNNKTQNQTTPTRLDLAEIYLEPTNNVTAIQVDSTPSNANLYVDDILLGTTPFTLEASADEQLFIEIEMDGYQRWFSEVKAKKGQTTQIIVNLQDIIQDALPDGSLGPEMLEIPSGEFVMGSNQGYAQERPAHWVAIKKPFAIGKYEITFAEYDAFAQASGRKLPDDEGWGRGQRPVINVSWQDAQAYAAWLSKQTGNRYRLPSEAEWEYTTRAGSTGAYPWGDNIEQNRANCTGCNNSWTPTQPEPTGSFEANRFGLHDTVGNVKEWTADCWNDSYIHAPRNGGSWTKSECDSRVVRGGFWKAPPEKTRSAHRSKEIASHTSKAVGFRLVREIDDSALPLQVTELD